MKNNQSNITVFHASSYGFLTRILVMALAAMLAAYLLPGVYISNFFTAAIAVVLISFLDNILRPALIIVTLPMNNISQNIIIFLVNSLVVLLTAKLVRGFSIPGGFLYALIFSSILTLADWLLQLPGSNPPRQTFQPRQHNNADDDPNHFDDYEEIK